MAKATVQYKEVVQPIEKVTLEINQSEAITLLAILARVGGCPLNSPRKYADSIYTALRDATNINHDKLRETDEHRSLRAAENDGHRNSIHFYDYGKGYYG